MSSLLRMFKRSSLRSLPFHMIRGLSLWGDQVLFKMDSNLNRLLILSILFPSLSFGSSLSFQPVPPNFVMCGCTGVFADNRTTWGTAYMLPSRAIGIHTASITTLSFTQTSVSISPQYRNYGVFLNTGTLQGWVDLSKYRYSQSTVELPYVLLHDFKVPDVEGRVLSAWSSDAVSSGCSPSNTPSPLLSATNLTDLVFENINFSEPIETRLLPGRHTGTYQIEIPESLTDQTCSSMSHHYF